MPGSKRSDPSSLAARLRRRLVTIPAFCLTAAVFWALAPLTLLLAVIVDLARGRRDFVGVRVWAFFGGYLLINVYGQLLLLLAWIGTGFGLFTARRVPWTYAIQTHWAGLLFTLASWLFRLRWSVEGGEQVVPAPAIYLIRHASIIDTMIPSRYITGAHGVPLRFVVKRELLNEPCLDIAGHWLANHFVDREPDDSQLEIEAIERLAAGVEPGEGLAIYPEGTRFTADKRARVIARLEVKDPALAAKAKALQHTLLPRVAGTLALMRGAPLGADVVIVAHHGLGGFATLADLWSGSLIGRSVQVAFWRYPAASLPSDDAGRAAWIQARWAELDRWVTAHEAGLVEAGGVEAGAGQP